MAEKNNDEQIAGRRAVLGVLGLGAVTLFGCGGGSASGNASPTSTDSTVSAASTTTSSATTTSTGSAGACVLTPQETAGPYPLLALLSNSAIVRKNITDGKTGIPLTLTLTLENVNKSCAPIANAAVYIWHCDKDGEYSGYSSTQNGNHAGESYLRGIQLSDSNGQVTFTTIYPGWYPGRITHIHLQVYLNDNLAVTATATTQIAFPPEVTAAVYSSALYAHGQNTSVAGFSSDNVFSDGTTYQMAAITGDVTNGYNVALTVGIAV